MQNLILEKAVGGPMRQIKTTGDNYQLAIDELKRPIVVKRAAQARRMTLRVSQTQRDIVLTIPRHAKLQQAGAFVTQHLDWLKTQLASLPEPVPFINHAVIPLEGVPHKLRFLGPRAKAATTQRSVVAILPPETPHGLPVISVLGLHEHAARRLSDWLRKRARDRLTESAGRHAGGLGLKFVRLTVRDQTSRWGSCSSSKALSFSWRLIFAPASVLDYVAAHEVAHLKEMNHSPRFWKLVEKTMPGHRDARSWLRRHGHDLHRYGASE
jgi:predicted metal-dependent hydrolase